MNINTGTLKPQSLMGRDRERVLSSVHFTIEVFRLEGVELGDLHTFKDYFEAGSIEQILAATEHFSSTMLTKWHESQRTFETSDHLDSLVLQYLGLDSNVKSLETCVSAICQEVRARGLAQLNFRGKRIILQLPDGTATTYTNPIIAISRRLLALPTTSIWCGLTHGRITKATILINRSGQSFLIDFPLLEYGPVLLDYAALEMVIRLEGISNIYLKQRVAFEEYLLDADPSSHLDQLPLQLTKSEKLVKYVRELALTQTNEGVIAYLFVLLCTALKHVTKYQPNIQYTTSELLGYAHSFVLAAMLSDHICVPVPKDSSLPEQAKRSLWIDNENKEVWVEGLQVDLTPQDFAILSYLYQHRGKLRSRQEIVEDVLGSEADGLFLEESRLNSAISRLRKKIEPNSEHPQYILNVRGHGYKLEL